MKTLEYRNLNTSSVRIQYKKALDMFHQDNLMSMEIKKTADKKLYKAKLDHKNDLLFKIGNYKGTPHAFMLEVVCDHIAENSRFLKRCNKEDQDLMQRPEWNLPVDSNLDDIHYINEDSSVFNFLDKIISLDQIQEQIYFMPPPLILIGSAGSGKTALILEKIKLLVGDILYVTHSDYLAKTSRDTYYAFDYTHEEQNIDFLSYREYLETIKIPDGSEITFKAFQRWFVKTKNFCKVKNEHKLFEEFKGVISSSVDKKYMTQQEYLKLGIKQSIFTKGEREEVYGLFLKYLSFLKENSFYDVNLISFDYLSKISPRYDFVVIDEVQDLTNIQLSLILKSLREQGRGKNFLICGDSNQIVHPNFFSWSSLKSMFYKHNPQVQADLVRILNTNYRNSPEIIEIANRILKIKTIRFGSIDRESHYLMTSSGQSAGRVEFLFNKPSIKRELNNKTKASTKYAVIVMWDELKKEAREFFKTPLVFSIHEVKGLEYENIILYDIVSSSVKEFNEIIANVNIEDVNSSEELIYARGKDKLDKSLEVYKFFINSIYVAVTRSVRNLYWIESQHNHRLIKLLGISESKEEIKLEVNQSDINEWQKEANKLEMQGKTEQVEEIRKNILKVEKVPWVIHSIDKLASVEKKAMEGDGKDKKTKEARQLIFDYALLYQETHIFKSLQDRNFKRAFEPSKGIPHINRRYYIDYNALNIKGLKKTINRYGVDYRNPFNETPLMNATKFNNTKACLLLLDCGANKSLRDNYGRNPLQIAFMKIYRNKNFDQEFLGKVYRKLSPRSISLKVKRRLVKLDKHLMEYFLFNAMVAFMSSKMRKNSKLLSLEKPAFATEDFVNSFEHLSPEVILEKRKKRSYISSILSKNEINRDYQYNRYLFIRIKRGYYMFNPALEVRTEERWINIYDLLNFNAYGKEDNYFIKLYVRHINFTRKKMEDGGENEYYDTELNNATADRIPPSFLNYH